MVAKKILCPDRLRRVPRRFSWLDHRLVRDHHFFGIRHSSLALYLFLVTVSDADGLSYYSDNSIEEHLNMPAPETAAARSELCAAGLIAYCAPLYQVLSLEKPALQKEVVVIRESSHCRNRGGDLASLGDILRQAVGGAT